MASSFITKDGFKGFWIDDSLMQVICWGLVSAIDSTSLSPNNQWLKNDHRNVIFDNSQGIFIGFMNLHLDAFLTNSERENTFKNVILEAKNFFLNKGDFVTTEGMNNFQLLRETKREFIQPIETKRLLNILDALYDVVSDRFNFTDTDNLNFDY